MSNTKSDATAIQTNRQRKRNLIRVRYSASRMNNTKWAEAVSTLEGLVRAYRIKVVSVDEPSRWGWLINWNAEHPNYIEVGDFGPVEFIFIEWLEIEPLDPEEVEQRLQSLFIPFVRYGSVLRLTGHVR